MAATNFRPVSLTLGAAGLLLFLLGGHGAPPFPCGDGCGFRLRASTVPVPPSARALSTRSTGASEKEVVEEDPSEEGEVSGNELPEASLPAPCSGRAGFLIQVKVPAGESLDGIRVEATVKDGTGEGSTSSADAAADGTAWIEVEPERDVILVARREGLQAGWSARRSPIAGGTERARIELDEGRPLSGVVLEDGSGSPVPGARVLAFPETFPFG